MIGWQHVKSLHSSYKTLFSVFQWCHGRKGWSCQTLKNWHKETKPTVEKRYEQQLPALVDHLNQTMLTSLTLRPIPYNGFISWHCITHFHLSWFNICMFVFSWYILCIPCVKRRVFFYIIFLRSVRIFKSNISTSGLLIDLILFERALGNHTDMSKLMEGFSVDSSSSKVCTFSLGMMMGSWKYT